MSLRTTEKDSLHQNIEQMNTHAILSGINQEDQKVANAVKEAIPQIEKVVDQATLCLQKGGRIFYLGAGTSGRLGVVDASELPPTFGVPPNMVIGLIAGGDSAIRTAVEFAEDEPEGAWRDMQQYQPSSHDLVVGIAASGTTPYVVGGLAKSRKEGLTTACIVCNAQSPVEAQADLPIVVNTGPEFITGSTRMKAGTAQKLVLNMISTAVMVKMGRVKGNKMVDMQLNNHKLVERGVRMLMQATGLKEPEALALLEKYGSVRAAQKAHRHSLK
jgi:N-acetylmuramic acid 6-phosphate etherase